MKITKFLTFTYNNVISNAFIFSQIFLLEFN
jgi:hypothetical protein